MQRRIAVIEDEATIAASVAARLRAEGFDVEIARDGTAGVDLCRTYRPDLVILDLMLPGIDGIEVCRLIQRDRRVPVLMLTARDSETDLEVGLGVGADDYMTKPFSPRELLARVKAVLRRGPYREEAEGAKRVGRGPITIDADRHEVLLDGEPVRFTATEFRLLHFLALYPGRVFTRDTLMRRVMGEEVVLVDRNVDVHIRAIRSKLGVHREWVETVRGVGYRFRDTSG